jgi:NAD(P)-dependent dehydrogenase (short-subunit alcohol dehydrogenase family)
MAATPVKRVLVTGANKGIGLQICRKILETEPDAHVLLCSRNLERGQKAVDDLKASDASAAGRVELLELNVNDEASIDTAAGQVKEFFKDEEYPLYAICNNAGIGFGQSIMNTLKTNFYGTKLVSEKFLPLLDPKIGRICNIASASGPMYVRESTSDVREMFSSRKTNWPELEDFLKRATNTGFQENAYGLSKAAVNQWTMQFAAEHPNLRINSCSPGYILTDLTAGMGATLTPEQSKCHVAPLFLLFGDVPQPEVNKGRYYGSDAVRSPLDEYRNPGDPPYDGD